MESSDGDRARLEVVIVTGLSGSGKSVAIHALEDLGFYCIDNLPAVLVERFLELYERAGSEPKRVALGIDLREGEFFAALPGVLSDLEAAGYRSEVVFLDARDAVLLRRFSESRRPHPLGGADGPAAGIARERALLGEIRARADRIVDTSDWSVHRLRDEVHRLYRDPRQGEAFTVLLLSFGFKHGAPVDADMVLDVRFLPNPYFDDALRPFSGLDAPVSDYVLQQPDTGPYLAHLEGLLHFTLPRFQREGKRYLTVAIGCTGGRHRSVVIVEHLAGLLDREGWQVRRQHRDVER